MADSDDLPEPDATYYERPYPAPAPIVVKPKRPRGRPKGSVTKNHSPKPMGRPLEPDSPHRKALMRREILDRVHKRMEVTPLEVMILTMIDLWKKDEKIAACSIAEKAAPYIHPKLSAIQQTIEGGDKPIQVENQQTIFDEMIQSIELIARTRVLAEEDDEAADASAPH